MSYGLRLNNVRLPGGRVKVPGLDGVPAIFTNVTLERRGETGSGEPIWTLRAALSYQNDFLLKSAAFTKRIEIEYVGGRYYEAVPEPGVEPQWEPGVLRIEGVTLCLLEEPRP